MSELFSNESPRQAGMGISNGQVTHEAFGDTSMIRVTKTSMGVYVELLINDNDSHEERQTWMYLSIDTAEVLAHTILAAAKLGTDPGQDGKSDNQFVFTAEVGPPKK